MSDFLLRLGISHDLIVGLRLDLLGRLLLATLLGGLIGLEREVSGKPAGLRTNLLICVGATLLMELSMGLAGAANAANAAAGVTFRSDPGRIAAQIVSGVGFIGAGTILRARGNIVGLTSAATIWVVAAIGMAVGAHAYVEAAGTTFLVVVSLVVLGRMEELLKSRRTTRRYVLVLAEPEALEEVESALRRAGLESRVESVSKGRQIEVGIRASGPSAAHDRLVREAISTPRVHRIERTH
ncbi:MAG: MgtC/SapB family protein [Gemmatimonadetes bacterium]|nr:MgtC/SapB family protein [Gemmatimonadota bacterium]